MSAILPLRLALLSALVLSGWCVPPTSGLLPKLGKGTSAELVATQTIFRGEPIARISAKVKPIINGVETAEQLLMVDTGSSTLGFCNHSLTALLESEKIDLFACALYGGGYHGWWGPLFKGDIQGRISKNVLRNVYFAVMAQEVGFCKPGLGSAGIFGIAFRQLNKGYPKDEEPSDWTEQSVGSCPSPSEGTPLANPLIHALTSDGSAPGYLGISWSGDYGDGEAMMYFDDDAITNEYFIRAASRSAFLSVDGFYNVVIMSMAVDGVTYSSMPAGPYKELAPMQSTCESTIGMCILDTGTPVLLLPKDVYEASTAASAKVLTITLLASDKADSVAVNMDLAWLRDNKMLGHGGNIILGLPLWKFSYTMFDLRKLDSDTGLAVPKVLLVPTSSAPPSKTAALVV